MKKLNKLLKITAIFILLLVSNQLIAQTSTSPTQNVCAGSLSEPYLINPPTTGSTYLWTLSGGGTLNNGTATNNITVDWGVTLGTFVITVIETDANGCQGAPVTVDVTIIPLDNASFTLTDYCEGSPNSATVTGTSGGVFTFTIPPSGGETINASTGEITGGLSGTTYSVIYTTSGICSQTSTQTVTVNPLDNASFTLTDYCEGSPNSATVTGTSGGVFTFTIPPSVGETINASTGEITGGLSGTTYSITYTTSGICSQTSIMSVTIFIAPTTGPISHW